MTSALWSASAVMQSCFAITFELQCSLEHVHGVARQDHPCLHSQHLLSRMEGSAQALTCRLREN